jgi:hydroxymethylpyrimidine kinase/phosphomethylpyrimidine kinase/thiamine-phosphate diphosphorylase
MKKRQCSHPNLSPLEKGPTMIVIGGLDTSGGAGLSSDLKALYSLGLTPKCVTTHVTAQTHGEVQNIQTVTEENFLAQIKSSFSFLEKGNSSFIKLGMVGKKWMLEKILPWLLKFEGTLICDPVFLSSSGHQLVEEEVFDFYKKFIFPHISLMTPNLPEALKILGKKATSLVDIEEIGEEFLSLGVKSVLIKGGHFSETIGQNNKDLLLDYFCSKEKKYWIKSPRIQNFEGETIRGTGCFLASAVMGSYALGLNQIDGLLLGRTLLNSSIRRSKKEGKTFILGPTSIDHFEDEDFPWIENSFQGEKERLPFNSLTPNEPFPWLYPIVDRASWIPLLASCKVEIFQLRIKDLKGLALEEEIKKAVALANDFQMRLFINDFWELALKYKAYGVHLGQEDLEHANLEDIKKKGLRLGLSSHSYEEGAIAKSFSPSYIALGPVYFTQLKSMSFSPQGIGALKTWKKLFPCPVVAIGGINLERLPDVMEANPDLISVVRDITLSKKPEEKIEDWQRSILSYTL